MTGHLLGCAGAFEFAICASRLRDGVIPPTINQFNPDPAAIWIRRRTTGQATVDVALSTLVWIRRAQRDAAVRRVT